jgi:hypothetical protein
LNTNSNTDDERTSAPIETEITNLGPNNLPLPPLPPSNLNLNTNSSPFVDDESVTSSPPYSNLTTLANDEGGLTHNYSSHPLIIDTNSTNVDSN